MCRFLPSNPEKFDSAGYKKADKQKSNCQYHLDSKGVVLSLFPGKKEKRSPIDTLGKLVITVYIYIYIHTSDYI